MTELHRSNVLYPERQQTMMLDTLVVLGHNKSPFRSDKRLIADPWHLSPLSKLNIVSAGILCHAGLTNNLILSTGQTFGANMPSEAYAMYEFFIKKFPNLAHVNVLLEDTSIDTAGNARESIKIIKKEGFKDTGLISTGDHATNADTLFTRSGHRPKYLYASEQVYARYLELKYSKAKADSFLRDYRDLTIINGDYFLEHARGILLNTVDPKGNMLNVVTRFTRQWLTISDSP